jgi:hypothetical protein
MRLPFKLKYRNQEIPFTLPTRWEDITAREYKAILDLPDNATAHDVLPCVTGIPAETWEQSNDAQVYMIVKENLSFILTPMPDVTQFDHLITFNGKTYNVMKDLGELSIGQWKDIEKECLIPVQQVKRPIDAIQFGVLLAAIYLQPVFDTILNDRIAGNFAQYDYSKAVALSRELVDMPIIDCLRLQRFFFQRTQELLQAIHSEKLRLMETAKRLE